MRYLVRCHNCSSHGEIACDELREDLLCPRCKSVPGSYSDNGVEYCWLHREQMSGKYPMSRHAFFTEYAWRGHESRFPNAKLYEAWGDELDDRAATMDSYCRSCENALQEWLASLGDD
jgi:hypothetical protein